MACDLFIWSAGYANPISTSNDTKIANYESLNFMKILQAIKDSRNGSDKRFVFLSSGGCTYTADSLPYKEEDEAKGTNDYGKMKLLQEATVKRLLPNSAIIRLANVYGPDQPSGKGQGVIAEWFKAISTKENPRIFGDRNSFRDYINISDATNAIEKIAKSELLGIFNVGSGRSTTLDELEKNFKELFGENLMFDFREERNFDRLGYSLSVEKMWNLLAWKPKIALEEGLRKIFEQNFMGN